MSGNDPMMQSDAESNAGKPAQAEVGKALGGKTARPTAADSGAGTHSSSIAHADTKKPLKRQKERKPKNGHYRGEHRVLRGKALNANLLGAYRLKKFVSDL